jgi:cell division protein FtsL
MRKPIVFIILIITIVITLSIVQVTVSNSLSTTGIELAKIEEKITFYKRQNAILHEKVLVASSFTTIASKAAEMGFIDKQSRLFLPNSPLAVKP